MKWAQIFLARKIWKKRTVQKLRKAGDSQFLNYRKIFQLCFAVRTSKLLQNVCIQETPHHLRPSIQNRRQGILTRAVCLLHDDARRNADPRTRDLPEYFKWQSFENPPYSPDLGSSDYHFFSAHQRIFVRPESEEGPGDKRRRPGLAGRLGSAFRNLVRPQTCLFWHKVRRLWIKTNRRLDLGVLCWPYPSCPATELFYGISWNSV